MDPFISYFVMNFFQNHKKIKLSKIAFTNLTRVYQKFEQLDFWLEPVLAHDTLFTSKSGQK